MYRQNLLPFLLAVSLGVLGYSQEEQPIRHGPAPNTDPSSGIEMYRTYFAVCHGLDGKGNGPAAAALKQRPSDLTLLRTKNGGEFHTFRVSNIIQADAAIPAHGSQDMPMWGNVFRALNRDETLVKLRVHNLTQYIASMQQK